MKYLLLSTLLLCSLLVTQANASVASDIRAGLSFKTVIIKALRSGESVDQVLRQALRAAPRQKAAVLAAAFSISPRLTQSIVRVAINLGINAGDVVKLAVRVSPKSANQAVMAAVAVAPAKIEQIMSGAVSAGAPVEEVTAVVTQQMGQIATGGAVTGNLEQNPVFDTIAQNDDSFVAIVPDNIIIPPSRSGDASVASFY